MVEYLYDAIRAVAGQDITVSATITDEMEQVITTGCCLMVHDKDDKTVICEVDGVYVPERLQTDFVIPAAATAGLSGRYWWCVQYDGNNLCFKAPLYLKA